MQDNKIKEVNSMFQQVDDRRKVGFLFKLFIPYQFDIFLKIVN